MRLISNKKIDTHLTAISKLLDNADEVIFCVAFLKKSGLDSIIENLQNKVTKCQFYIWTDFYLTEPTALRTLFKNGHEVYITKKERTTYHPKIFYFRKGNSIDILVGSTNLTSGGLETNIEASIALTTSPNSVIDNEFNNLLASLNEHSTLVNEQIISNYEMKFLAYRKRHNKADVEFQVDLQKIDELMKEQ
jgi:HKD family nuclease